MFELKSLKREALGAAQRKAVRYRLLNEPRLTESICRDILAVEPENQDALITLILSLTDQFGSKGRHSVAEAMDLLSRLAGEYEREYYAGIICERRAIGQLEISGPGSGEIAFSWFRRAMDHFESAEALSAPDNDDAVLRWNTCARIVNLRADVRPPEPRRETMLE
jgi:hypothetical protein